MTKKNKHAYTSTDKLDFFSDDPYKGIGCKTDIGYDDGVVCGRIMIGSGDDTYDPICELPKNHKGSCKSSSAIDQHKLITYRENNHE